MQNVLPFLLGFAIVAVIIVIVNLADKHLLRRPFWRKLEMYPGDHAVALERVYQFVATMVAGPEPSDGEIVAKLTSRGVPKLDAELLVRFVPMAFAWMVLRKMGVSSFASTFIVYNKRDRPVYLPIVNEHYFAAALGLADEISKHGFSERISEDTFKLIMMRSAEMNSANKALAAGKDISKGQIMPPMLLGLYAEEFAVRREAA